MLPILKSELTLLGDFLLVEALDGLLRRGLGAGDLFNDCRDTRPLWDSRGDFFKSLVSFGAVGAYLSCLLGLLDTIASFYFSVEVR